MKQLNNTAVSVDQLGQRQGAIAVYLDVWHKDIFAGDKAFCSGGDQKVRGHGGYVGEDEIPRLNVLDLQRLIRVIPKPVVAMVAGYYL